jgi:hypothetical protein
MSLIVCTFWDDIAQKAEQLSEKRENYRKLKIETIVIALADNIKDCTKLLNQLDVRVITSDKLTEVLDGKLGRVKRA